MKIIRVGRHITLDFRSARVVRDSAFSELSSKLSGQPGVTDPDGLAYWIGSKKYGKAGMAAKAAAGRTGDDFEGEAEGATPDHGFVPEDEHPMTCLICGEIKSSHTTKDDWSPEAREAAAEARRKGGASGEVHSDIVRHAQEILGPGPHDLHTVNRAISQAQRLVAKTRGPGDVYHPDVPHAAWSALEASGHLPPSKRDPESGKRSLRQQGFGN